MICFVSNNYERGLIYAIKIVVVFEIATFHPMIELHPSNKELYATFIY
jgi:hypothetical protein